MINISKWLDNIGPQYPKCDPTKLACTKKLMLMLAVYGELTLPIASDFLKHWLSGQNGEVSIAYATLMQDGNFVRSHNGILYKTYENLCKGGMSIIEKDTFVKDSDLFFALHDYVLTATLRVTRTGRKCDCPKVGELVLGNVFFEYKDDYDWRASERTHLPVIGDINQQLFVDLRDCSDTCCKDFKVRSKYLVQQSRCCP